MDSPQFCAHGELHKERFDKLIGLINAKRCKRGEFEKTRRVPKRLLSATSAICSDINGDMRLENGRIVSAGEIVDDCLKEAVCRLRRDKPICNDGLSDHRYDSASSPLLQLYDVTFRISRINHMKQTDTVYFRCGNFSDCASSGCDHCFQRFIHVVHRECNVAESALVSSGRSAFDQLIVAEDLQCRPMIVVSR